MRLATHAYISLVHAVSDPETRKLRAESEKYFAGHDTALAVYGNAAGLAYGSSANRVASSRPRLKTSQHHVKSEAELTALARRHTL